MQAITIPALNTMQRVTHAFTTRNDGLGVRYNGIKSPSDWDALAVLFGVRPDRVVTVNQVHGDAIVVVDEDNYRALRTTKADAMITNAPGIAIGVETADCVPVLLIDPAIPAVAAVHAGWRSTVKKIVRKAVALMNDTYGSDPSRLTAAFGPAIGPECYEVDEPVMGPVREAFRFWKDVASPRGNGKWSLNLIKANWLELLQVGVQEDHIHSLGMCTSCRRDQFYSFRAEGRTGRMLSVVMIKP
jgi:purine-nucleoside/S-methyl-5'-thioadenosine phosphorylase / adenosine deaminase